MELKTMITVNARIKTLQRMKNACVRLIQRLITAKRKLSEPEDRSTESSQTKYEQQQQKTEFFLKRTSKNCKVISKCATYAWFEKQKGRTEKKINLTKNGQKL